jgi:thiol-disulfide isomerase/thioredoxin
MATLRERLEKWKETRSTLQKAGDIFFWVLLLLLLVPGPRKVISTTVNRVVLLVKSPGMIPEAKQVSLSAADENWMLRNDQGEVFSLGDLSGQPVFLNFWATWCPPCRAELPEIQKSYEKHWEKMTYLLITDQQPGEVKAFMEKHGFDLPVTYAASPVPPSLQHGSIPTTYILSPEGRIVVKKTGAVNWDSRGMDKIIESLVR